MKQTRAQVAMEFLIIMGAVMFFLSIFFLTIQNNTEEKRYQRESVMMKEVALSIKNEIDLATNSIDGYSRDFEIPRRIGNMDYIVNVTEGLVYIRTVNEKHAMAFTAGVVVGEINITSNIIKKINGEVFLNQ